MSKSTSDREAPRARILQWAALAALLLAGCEPQPCVRMSDCANGLVCSPSGQCITPPTDGSVADGGAIDALSTDAGIDAPIDAPLDTPLDAPLDASAVDATLDASAEDAAPDAAIDDAAVGADAPADAPGTTDAGEPDAG